MLALQSYALGEIRPSADDILSAVAENEQRKASLLKRYTGLRRYTLRNSRFHVDASMTVRLEYRQNTGKTFTILEKKGSERVLQRVFEPILTAETEASRGSTRNQALLSPANYRAQMIGQEWQRGRECWVLAIEPKHRSKYVIRGKIWVDRRESEPVQLQGRPAASVSFWVGEPSVFEQFAKQNGFWMPARMTSKSWGLLLDYSELTIDYYGYEFSMATNSSIH